MIGGTGDDTYVVDALDTITELAGEGVDTVRSAVTWTLGANLENLILLGGSAALNGTGNELDNQITGNTGKNLLDGGIGADTLVGGAGNDTYVVDNVGDVITELSGQGTDIVRSSISWTLGANLERLELTGTDAIDGFGNSLNNRLTGNSAANLLDGGTGNDTMVGGLGNDTYVVDSTTDVVTESSNQGADLVLSSVTWTLGSNLENLTLTGASAINGTGNTLANLLRGNAAANTLSGGNGADTLIGGAGVDSLTGGSGADVFRFESAGDSGVGVGLRDIITDFVNGTDKIDLSAIDANSGAAGKQDFVGIGTAAFSAAGQVRYVFDGTNTIVQANTDSNFSTVEFEIQVQGNHPLPVGTNDLILIP